MPVVGSSASGDTDIEAANPNTNHGAELALFTKPAGTDEKRVLMKFNPIGNVSEAMLYLHVESTDSGVTISIYRVTTDWGEFSATWSTAFIEPWDSPGGDYNTMPVISFQPANDCTVQLNITALVQDWATTPTSNFGMILIATGPATSQTRLTANGNATNSPLLVMTLTP